PNSADTASAKPKGQRSCLVLAHSASIIPGTKNKLVIFASTASIMQSAAARSQPTRRLLLVLSTKRMAHKILASEYAGEKAEGIRSATQYEGANQAHQSPDQVATPTPPQRRAIRKRQYRLSKNAQRGVTKYSAG